MMNSDDSTPLVFSLVCRTCLKNYSDLISIFDSKAAHMLIYCDFSTVSEGDGLPGQICLNCIQILKQSYTFKQLCEKSEVTLRKTLTENVNSHSQDPIFSYKKGEFSDKLQFISEKNIEDCNNQENSLDSSDITDDVVKNELSHHEYTSEYAEIFKNENIINIESEKNKDDTAVRDDLISFLEKPLPPPLPYQCQHCSQSFAEENDLKIHQSVHNSELICLACRKTFTGRQMLKRHLKIHLIKKPHLCKICNKSYSESHALTKHLRRHSGIPREKKHFCSECGQGFSEPYYLKVHMRKHTGERPLVCTECDKRFADPRSYKIHAMIHSGERPYKCNFCTKTFVQNANLTKHLRVHTGEKPYSCKLCDKRFSQSSSLDKHVRTHTGEKIHTCSRCDKRYSDKTALKKHEKTHQEGQKYDCRQCCVSFVTKSELVLHCKEHGEVKRKLCGKKFSSRANLQEHVHTHSKEKSFECNIYY